MKTVILHDNLTGFKRASGYIRSGRLVAFPTETVYGLGADAFNPQAVARIFAAKNRPSFDPLISHVCSLEMAFSLWDNPDNLVISLAEAFWPGPLTIVAAKNPLLPDIVTSGLDSAGVRYPDHETALKLIRFCNTPLAAPSANLFGHVSPTCLRHVMDDLKGRISAVIRGKTSVGIESTVVRVFEGKILLLRHGGIPVEKIRKLFPDVITGDELQKVYSPGHAKKHYAPAVKMILFSTPEDFHLIVQQGIDLSKTGVISFSDNICPEAARSIILSPSACLEEAASVLFQSLRSMEKSGVSTILFQTVPDTGIGLAINDRIQRASAEN